MSRLRIAVPVGLPSLPPDTQSPAVPAVLPPLFVSPRRPSNAASLGAKDASYYTERARARKKTMKKLSGVDPSDIAGIISVLPDIEDALRYLYTTRKVLARVVPEIPEITEAVRELAERSVDNAFGRRMDGEYVVLPLEGFYCTAVQRTNVGIWNATIGRQPARADNSGSGPTEVWFACTAELDLCLRAARDKMVDGLVSSAARYCNPKVVVNYKSLFHGVKPS